MAEKRTGNGRWHTLATAWWLAVAALTQPLNAHARNAPVLDLVDSQGPSLNASDTTEPVSDSPAPGPSPSQASGADLAPSAAASKSLSPPVKHASNRSPAELASLDGGELLARADETKFKLREFRQRLEIPKELSKLRKQLEVQDRELRGELSLARRKIRDASRWFVLNDLLFRYHQKLHEIHRLRTPFDRFVTQVGDLPTEVDQILKEWSEVETTLQSMDAPEATQRGVQDVLRVARATRLRASRAATAIANTGALVQRMQSSIQALLDQALLGGPSLFQTFEEPGEEAPPSVSMNEAYARIWETTNGYLETARAFVKDSFARLLLHALLLLALLFGTLSARRHHSPVRAAEADHLVLRHPWASSILLAGFSTPFLYPAVAVLPLMTVFTIVIATSIYLLLKEQRRSWLTPVGALTVWTLMASQVFIYDLPRIDRWSIALEGLSVLCMCVLLIRSPPFAEKQNWRSSFVFFARSWAFATGAGLVAWVLGYFRSAVVLIDGTGRVMLLSVGYRVAYEICSSLISLAVSSSWAQHSNAIVHHHRVIIERARMVLRWLVVFLWFKSCLNSYALRQPAKQAWEALLNATVSTGTLDFSFSSGLVLIVGVFVSVFSARMVRFILSEDVMPRTGLRVGTWTAITSSTYYIVLGFGIFTALAAAGVKLDKIAILVSALGVGIGFGLQNIVQNFVSGLIIMFERPVNVGDKIEIQNDMLGTVQNIGFRASRVRTFDGAEVIVPNSDLISNRVVNWTLTDDRRRIEVNVGVAYGSDLEGVIKNLLRVAQEHPEVLKDPPPETLFMEFGDSSLNLQLRCHTDDGSRWLNIRSELSLAIDEAFRKAHIEIPFPQRDLHLRSVADEAKAKIKQP